MDFSQQVFIITRVHDKSLVFNSRIEAIGLEGRTNLQCIYGEELTALLEAGFYFTVVETSGRTDGEKRWDQESAQRGC